MFRFKTFLASAALTIALPGVAEAALVTVQDNPNNGPSVFAPGLGRGVSIKYNGENRTVGAGVFSLQYGSQGSWTDFMTFCLQLSERLTLPKQHQEVNGADYFPGKADRSALGVLYGNFMTPEYGLRNANTAAAMQTIIWEIVEDGADKFDLSKGSFKLKSDDVLREANKLWALVLSGDFKPVNFNVFTARGTQDLLVSQVPIPGALILFGTALAGFGASQRHRKT